MKHYASVSFGKDSLAMLLMKIDRGEPIDEVVFYDTGMEFQAIYDTRDKVLPILAEKGIKFTQIESDPPFLFNMFDRVVQERGGGTHKGYSWCGGICRWGTRNKANALAAHTKDGWDYVGIAFDEPERITKEYRENKRFPLYEWGIPEAEALEYCYDRGFTWEENGIRLYDILDRVSCFCCGNKNLKELRNIFTYLPDYWERLKDLQSRTTRPFRRKEKQTIHDLEKRFINEKLKQPEPGQVLIRPQEIKGETIEIYCKNQDYIRLRVELHDELWAHGYSFRVGQGSGHRHPDPKEGYFSTKEDAMVFSLGEIETLLYRPSKSVLSEIDLKIREIRFNERQLSLF